MYIDTGASTRKRKGVGAVDAVHVVADILASLNDPAAVQNARSTEEKNPTQVEQISKLVCAQRKLDWTD